jgi:hypothetical protein
MLMNMQLQASGHGGFEESKLRLATLALLDNLDGLSELPPDPHGNRRIFVGSEDVATILERPRQSDREIRRFLARRLYDAYSRGILRDTIVIDAMDMAVCGASLIDFLRNGQLLEEEAYLFIRSNTPDSVSIEPRAKLIREVERYGATREDAAGEADFLASVSAYPSLARVKGALSLEYGRYSTARTALELESVFKAVAPVVEDMVKDLLTANGSEATYPGLGPAINALRGRGLGNVALYAELSHVLKFARDLASHGAQLSEPVLRIACENCFQLVPQLGALYARA